MSLKSLSLNMTSKNPKIKLQLGT